MATLLLYTLRDRKRLRGERHQRTQGEKASSHPLGSISTAIHASIRRSDGDTHPPSPFTRSLIGSFLAGEDPLYVSEG